MLPSLINGPAISDQVMSMATICPLTEDSAVNDASSGKISESANLSIFQTEFCLPSTITVRKKRNDPIQETPDSTRKYPWMTLDIGVEYMESHDYFVNNFLISEGNIRCLEADCLAIETAAMGLQSIVDRSKEDDLLFNDLWLVPTHVRRNHWILFTVLIRAKKIIILDSLYQGGSIDPAILEHVQILRLLISNSYSQCFQKHINWDHWKTHMPFDMVHEICSSSSTIRNWIRFELLSKSLTRLKCVAPLKLEVDDCISEVYLDFDEKVTTGSLQFSKPWLQIPCPEWLQGLVDGQSTRNLLASILKTLWSATEEVCGAGSNAFI
ncbi:Sentrin-specific protease 2 [Frankliniella fusca]|uniref:Sentrin-specific protease 2 n=1 Tax=Frankliniella fusca TaxID=407009 RepID=A0AAE1I0T1_9NEOP|nr:Sentrin-specific protease 2 [Frankliniella fusca]